MDFYAVVLDNYGAEEEINIRFTYGDTLLDVALWAFNREFDEQDWVAESVEGIMKELGENPTLKEIKDEFHNFDIGIDIKKVPTLDKERSVSVKGDVIKSTVITGDVKDGSNVVGLKIGRVG